MIKINTLFIVASFICTLTACNPTSQPVTAPAITPVNKTPQVVNSLSGAKILVFSKTKGWRHDSIPEGILTFEKLALAEKFSIVSTEDAAIFNDVDLKQFNTIVFLNTTLDILNSDQEFAMERYIQAGGGFVGIHAAADTEWEGDWFWYRNLVGAVFKNHPSQPSNVQQARVYSVDPQDVLLEKIPQEFSLADEWYNYRDIYEDLHVLQEVDEKSYQGGEHGEHHPITWVHEYDGGRVFYTGLGHSIETFQNPIFQQLLVNGLKYAVAKNYQATAAPLLDYKNSRPESNRFVKKTLVDNLDEPVKFAFFPNGDALIALRPGKLTRLDYKTQELSDAGKVNAAFLSRFELGLVGVAIDPEFPQKPYIYTVFSIQDDQGKVFQRLSRFNWKNNQLDSNSEKMILQHGVDQNCCHTGGDLQFTDNRELYYSTGDNSNPHDQEGYSPMDFREDKPQNDSLRGAGNTQDLRGKILRIHINDDASYSIPEGNLFKDLKQGRPEIYVMGARNPYTITWDNKTHDLFYGDVGPDANNDSDIKGSRGYDEINRVTYAGNFGWPLVVGKNKPYKYFDYRTQTTGDWVDPSAPKNLSPRNTGLVDLPPAQPAFIAYPYATSEEYPELGTGGRTALVADVFHSDNYPESKNRYSAYYNNKLFIMDFMRGWIKAVSFDSANGQIKKIESFAPQIKYALPIDARFSPDGSLYVLEYGMSWFTHNPDARLTRVEYVGDGNRPPIAKITASKTQTAAPAEIEVDATASQDLDGDKLQFSWTLECIDKKCEAVELGKNINQTITIQEPGKYQLRLVVTDTQGVASQDEVILVIGNEPATISLKSSQNTQFYWPNTHSFHYDFVINDKEDGKVQPNKDATNPMVTFSSINLSESSQGHQPIDLVALGKELVDANNCLGCHNLDEKKIGPAFKMVAKKYQNDSKAIDYLINKIGQGGNGVWGEMNMPGFSGLSEDNRRALATYVLSLSAEKPKSLPLSGEVQLNDPDASAYQFNVQYTDHAVAGIETISVAHQFNLKPALQNLADYMDKNQQSNDLVKDKYQNQEIVKISATGKPILVLLGDTDLTQIGKISLTAWSASESSEWTVKLYDVKSPDVILASSNNPTKNNTASVIDLTLMKKLTGIHSLVLSFQSKENVNGSYIVSRLEYQQ